jgi:hypothetical protein
VYHKSRIILNLSSYLFRSAVINRNQIYLHVILLNVIQFFILKIKFKINLVALKVLRRMRISRDKLSSNNTTFKSDFDLQKQKYPLCRYSSSVPHYSTHFITHNRKNVHVLMRPLMVAQWLRSCATNRKVAGSIPDGSRWFIDIILPIAPWPWGLPSL